MRVFVMFDSDNCPALASINGDEFVGERLIAAVAEFDSSDHLQFAMSKPLLELAVISVKPRDPEKPLRRLSTTRMMWINRDRIVSISPFEAR